MGEEWSGQPVEITPGTPKDVAQLRKNLIATMTSGAKNGATGYDSGMLSAKPNAMLTGAADMVSRMAGYGGYGNAQRTTPPGGGGNPGQPVFTPSSGGYPGGATPLPTPVPSPMPVRPTDPGMGGGRIGDGPGGQIDQQALLQMLMARAARQGGGMAGQAGGAGMQRGGGTTYGA